VDHKGLIDFQSLVDKNIDIEGFPSHEKLAYSMGRTIPRQKTRFLNLPQGPKSPDDVLHLVNVVNIRNPLSCKRSLKWS